MKQGPHLVGHELLPWEISGPGSLGKLFLPRWVFFLSAANGRRTESQLCAFFIFSITSFLWSKGQGCFGGTRNNSFLLSSSSVVYFHTIRGVLLCAESIPNVQHSVIRVSFKCSQTYPLPSSCRQNNVLELEAMNLGSNCISATDHEPGQVILSFWALFLSIKWGMKRKGLH